MGAGAVTAPSVEVFPADFYAQQAARAIAALLPDRGHVVITGGTTAAAVYPELAKEGGPWSGTAVYFSDERCVPPEHAESNFRMATETLLSAVGPGAVHRMPGEDDPDDAARAYAADVALGVDAGFDLVLLGMGADAHIAGLFPGSPALAETERYCVSVERPDGLRGLTLTPPALFAGRRFVVIVTGDAKADAVRRAVQGDEPVDACPARLLSRASDVTFLLDEQVASGL